MPKKPARNAFYFYMEHFKEEQKKKGITYPGGMKEVAVAADPSWKKLTSAQRAPFEQRARKEKARTNIPEMKYTSTGISYAEIEKQERLKKEQQENEREDIRSLINNEAYANKLDTYEFYLMDVNYYCKTTTDQYVIAEFSIIRFSLANGIINDYHEIINPGTLPAGYASDAKFACQTIGLEMPNESTYQHDTYRRIVANVFDYLTPNDDNEIPIIFTKTDQMQPVENFMQHIFSDYAIIQNKLKIYHLDTLFFYLVNAAAGGDEGFPKESLATMELNKDRFAYNPGLACDYHEKIPDKAHYCCLSRTKRWAFTIMDQCCPLLNIDIKPGVHVPEDFAVERIDMVIAEKQERLKTTVEMDGSLDTSAMDSTLESERATGYSAVTSCNPKTYKPLRRPVDTDYPGFIMAPPLEEDLNQLNLSDTEFPQLSGARARGSGRGRGRGYCK